MAQEELLQQDTGGLDPFDAPIPGSSLTQSKEAPLPYETAPEMNTPEEVTRSIWERVRENEQTLDGVLDSMRDGVPIEDIAQVLLFEGFRQGMYNPDTMLLSIEPVIYTLAFLANYAEIPAVLYPEEDFDGEEASEEIYSQLINEMEDQGMGEEVTLGKTTLKRPSAVPETLLTTEELPERKGGK
jgi:hypothetical protein